jgi:hypothetical protein
MTTDIDRLLHDHHRELERACTDLLGEAYADDARGMALAWHRFERRILAHIAAEEELLLPAYGREHPDDVALIRRGHDGLRRLLTPLGVDVELGLIRVDAVERLVAALRAHGAYEDRAMYPWAARHLDAGARTALAVRLGD